MVLLNDIKYACETCIKGHRSSTCSHTDRPLFEIKKKGRPVTQCEHCRQLRKTKQVHVKCVCQFKDGSEATTPTQPSKKGAKVPECPAFPAGLPKGLCASIAQQSAAQNAASSDVGHGVHKSCACDQDSVCSCCTPRVRAPRKRAKTIPEVRQDDSIAAAGQGARHALPRPILPKEKSNPTSSSTGHMTDMVHGSARHHTHEHAHFSPYGRAYEYSHGHELAKVQGVNSLRSYSPSSHDGPLDNQLAVPSEAPAPMWDPLPPVYDPYVMPVCGCGDDCTCPGCFQHRGQAASSDFALRASSCPNPLTCGSCTTSNDISLHPSPDPSFDYAMNLPPDIISNWLAQTMDFESNSFSAPPPFDYDHVLGSTVPWDVFQTPRQGTGNFIPDDGPQPNALWPTFRADQDMQDARTTLGEGGAVNFTEVPRANSVSSDSSHSSQHASTSFHHLDDTMDESESSSPMFPSTRPSSDVQRFLYPWSTTPQRASSSLPDLNAMMAHSCCSATKRMSSVILREASDGIIYAVSSVGSSSGSEIGTDDVSLSE